MRNEPFCWPREQTALLNYCRARDTGSQMNRLRDLLATPRSKDYLKAADNICRGGLYSIPPYGLIHFPTTIDWQGGAATKRGFSRLLHAHFFINDLIQASRQVHTGLYLGKAYEIVADWVIRNPWGAALNPMAWHDETTARRLITWIRFFDEARATLEMEKLAFLFTNIQKHAELLGTEDFYTRNTNHGMFQDQALLVYSDYFSCVEGSEGLRALACSRLKEYFQFIFSREGVHREHSPSYHLLTAKKLLIYSRYFENLGDPFGDYLNAKYQQATEYATHIIKPDGLLPQLGDTPAMKPVSQLWTENLGYRYARTRGREGAAPQENDMVFPEAGYAVFRDGWAEKEQATYILFTAAYHTNFHKHSDDLSLWIYSRGSDIVLESGFNGYNKDALAEYCYSSFAHNVLIVDNRGLPRYDRKKGATRITAYTLTPEKPSVTGLTERYPGVKHTRTVEFDKKKQIITVRDEISSRARHRYQLLWHLAPDIQAVLPGPDRVWLNRGNTRLLEVQVRGEPFVSLSKVRGQLEPIIMGWHFKNVDEKLPIDTLILEFQGKDACICTDFVLATY